jgi:AAA ATPase domain
LLGISATPCSFFSVFQRPTKTMPRKRSAAGLELCATVGSQAAMAHVPVRCRVGIATGMVIIGDPAEAGALRGQEIVGEVPGVAARLLALAPPDTVAIDRATRRLVGNLFDGRDLGAIETASGVEPIRGWQVLAESLVASRFEALCGATLIPLVGRDEEIGLLLRRWARAKAGDGQIVLISGEPGIGKSRLAASLEERLEGDPHLRLRASCSLHHQDSALFPSIEQLGWASGFARNDPPAIRLEKLEALLARAAPPDEDMALLADLLSLPALLRQIEGLAHR